MTDMKMTDHQNCRAWNCRTWNCRTWNCKTGQELIAFCLILVFFSCIVMLTLQQWKCVTWLSN